MRPVFRSKNALAYMALKEAILHGDLRPGQRLVIDELAADLGVSQIPIREALRQLEADGFVTSQPHIGVTVTDVHVGLVTEIFILLEALEIISSRAAAKAISENDLRVLEERIEAMDALVHDPDRWCEENKLLHLFISQRSGMALVPNMIATAFDHWDRVRRSFLKDVFAQRIEFAQQEHHQIAAAFRDRDADKVEQIIRAHNRSALAAYARQLDLQE